MPTKIFVEAAHEPGLRPDPPEQDGLQQELRQRHLQRRRKQLFVSFATILLVALLALLVVSLHFTYVKNQHQQAFLSTNSQTSRQLKLVAARLQEVMPGMSDPSLLLEIESGQYSLYEHLLRVFTSPAYLSLNQDDEQFLQDSWQIVLGSKLTGEDLQVGQRLLQEKGSRLVWLEELCLKEGFNGSGKNLENPTRVRSFLMISELPAHHDRIVGLLPLSSELHLAGNKAVIKLFVDGQLKQSFSYDELVSFQTSEEAKSKNVTIYWDTSLADPGLAQLSYLIQTDDGRGQWLDLEELYVPPIHKLTEGKIESIELQMNSEKVALAADQQDLEGDQPAELLTEQWFQLNCTDGLAMLTLFQADGELKAELYNLLGEQKTQTLSKDSLAAALRYQATEDDMLPAILQAANSANSNANPDSSIFFVKVSGANLQREKPLHFSLVQAETIALSKETPYRYTAVLAREAEQLLLVDAEGLSSWQAADQYDLLEMDSRLAMLKMQTEEGENISFAPVFDSEQDIYGLYVGSDTDQLAFEAWAYEGDAATLELEVLYEDGSSVLLLPGDSLQLKPSVNTLRLTAEGFLGDRKTYELKILRTPDSDGYHQVLEEFPFSYRTPLWALHLQQPQWIFTADNTGIAWQDFMTAQTKADTSLVDSSACPTHWVLANSPIYDGASWQAATPAVVAYFGDPRHALDMPGVFQFESLRFEAEVHTKEGISAMLENTFMASGPNDQIDYAQLLLEAGRKADISPFFLAAKIIQEMGPQGQSMLADGSLPGYEGIYNFYNIGSTPNPTVENGALINGALFAQLGKDPDSMELDEEEKGWLIPWDTPAKAITGGAIWIADKYVSIGQDTLYGQKFDLIADPELFLHQYAQNIQMAWSEGIRTYQAYRDLSLLDQAFVFKIPIFEGMPTQAPAWP